MPEGLPPALWDATTGTVKVDDLTKQFIETTKASAARAATIPEKPEGYKLEYPTKFSEPLKALEPFKDKLTIDEKDPRIPLLRAVAHEHGLPQTAVSDVLAIDAMGKLLAEQANDARMTAETAKLGEKGPARQAALANFLNAHLSPEEVGALAIDKVQSAAAFAAFEKLMTIFTSSSIPGNQPQTPTTPAAVPMKDRWYGGTQQKVS